MLVSSLTAEVHTLRSQRWFYEIRDERFFASDWGVTEFSSALSIKVRTGKLTVEDRGAVLRTFSSIMARSCQILPVLREHFRTAARFSNRHELGLRGGDALHLAICEAHGADICTLDQRMMDAAVALGIGTVMPA